MCRLAAWIGPPRALSALTHDPPHALLRQSWAPRLMLEARLNADGSGLCWYPEDGDPSPARYRSVRPLWSDENLASLAPRIRSRTTLAVVRSATPGLAVRGVSTPPFVQGRIACAHNGALENFRRDFMRPLRERLSDESYASIEGGTDTEHVFALVLESLAGGSESAALVEATVSALLQCREIARSKSGRIALNLLLSNGEVIVATRFAVGGPAPSLFLHEDEGLTLASEPLDDATKWREIPSDTLLVLRPGGRVDERPLFPL